MSPERIRPGSGRRSADGEATPPSEVEEPTVEDTALEEFDIDEESDDEQAALADEGSEPEPESEELAGRHARRVARARRVEVSVEPTDRVELIAPQQPGQTSDSDLEDATALLLSVDEERIEKPSNHGLFRRLYYGETHFDFVRRRRIWFSISAVIVVAGIISLATRGLDLSIDFVGGTSWQVTSSTLTLTEAQSAVSAVGLNGATVVALGNGSQRTIQVEAKLPKGQSAAAQTAEANKVAAALQKVTHEASINSVSITSVGPSWGGQITHKAIIALIVFFILIAIYISIFFEWRMALAAIVAVAHDILVTVGIYSLTGFLVTPDTVVAILTILGYSLYDTIVVFDRIRDNVKNLSVRDRLTFSDIVNVSMNQTLARSINTSLVAIMPILAVLVLGAEVLGATTLQYFGLALFVGLTTGAYSSIFIASPIVAIMKEREPRYRALRERIEQRGQSRWILSPAEVARGFTGEDIRAARGPSATSQTTGRVRPGSANGRAVAPSSDESSSITSNAASSQVAPRRPTSRNRRRGGRR